MILIKTLAIISAILIVISTVRRCIKMQREWRREDQEELRGLPRIPTLDESIAQELYGERWKQALAECRDGHLPGDCPLCGAR